MIIETCAGLAASFPGFYCGSGSSFCVIITLLDDGFITLEAGIAFCNRVIGPVAPKVGGSGTSALLADSLLVEGFGSSTSTLSIVAFCDR